MPRLGVNIDHVATLREARRGVEPDPIFAALICESSGSDSIVAHLREDRRHIKDRDVFILREVVKTKLNLEMSTNSEIVEIAYKLKPDQATLVPEKRQELTTEGGLDVTGNYEKIKRASRRLQASGIVVSLFIDPDRKQIDASRKLGIKMIELHTGRYADAKNEKEQEKHFKAIESAVSHAQDRGLVVNAGHGLDYHNVTRVSRIKGIEELNIGYSIICRAVLVGLERAIKEMKFLIK